ncbi:MAG: hypothetical protein [Bacteriophage sp.]|nr:MAG: hypothetical protein [Bacteriophage sp.]
MTREKAENIVNDFFKEMNPTFWNGKGNKPQAFKEQIWEFSLTDNVSLEITLSQDEMSGIIIVIWYIRLAENHSIC